MALSYRKDLRNKLSIWAARKKSYSAGPQMSVPVPSALLHETVGDITHIRASGPKLFAPTENANSGGK